MVYAGYGGIFDFTQPAETHRGERGFYDWQYGHAKSTHLTIESVRRHWVDDTRPENQLLLKSLGDLAGKRVLLLGNGTSVMEFYLLTLGAELTYTDISIEAVRHAQRMFSASELALVGNDRIEFHAVDGSHLPFEDASFDVIYGLAFVHHIEYLDPFFAEVKRCLKPGGICRFLDGAYSPVWQFAKGSFLRPLQSYVHKKRGISPEDLRATRRGGYRMEELRDLMMRLGFRDMVFVRASFFLYIVRRGLGKIVGWNPAIFERARPLLLFAKWLDNQASKTRFMRNNLITLVWGFTR